MKKNYFIIVLFFIANCYCYWGWEEREIMRNVVDKFEQQTFAIEKFAREKKSLMLNVIN